MSRIPPARTSNDRVRTHIKALIDEAKHQAETAPAPAQMFFAGMLSGLAASVEILDGGTAEKSMELMVQRLSAAIGQAYLDGTLPPQPTTDNPATDADRPLTREADEDLNRVIDLHGRWTVAGPPPLGKSLSRWWDARLIELREAILGPDPKDPS